MKYEIIFAPEAVEDFRGLRANERAAVKTNIERHLRFEPEKVSKSRIKKLRGLKRPQYCLRVEGIRVFYDVTDDRVEILAIIPKPRALRWLKEKGEII